VIENDFVFELNRIREGAAGTRITDAV